MLEDQQQKRRWSGYVCPDCRAVFRMPRDHEGQGVVCPSCRRVLRIAGAEEEVPPLVAPPQRTMRRIEPLVETSEGAVAAAKTTVPLSIWLTAGGALVLVVVGLSSLRGLRYSYTQAPELPTMPQPAVEFPTPTEIPAANENDPASPEFGFDEKKRAAEVIQKFLEAKTVDAAAELVFHPEVTRARLQQMFPDEAFSSGGRNLLGELEVPNPLIPIATGSVQTVDYEVKTVQVHLTLDGPKVDWEAWVAWSEMAWEDFTKEKRQIPTLFRVRVSSLNYYNFTFADEQRWQGYQLLSPDGERSWSGYVERGSPVETQLNREIESGSNELTLLLKFPADARSASQVIIEKVIHNSWTEISPPAP